MYLLLYSTDCIGTLHKAAEPLLWDVPNTKKPEHLHVQALYNSTI